MAEPKYVGVNIEPVPDGYILQKQENGIVGVDPVLISTGASTDTAANIGSGDQGLFKEKVGGELRFKKLKGGTNINVTATETDEVLITGAAVGEVNTAANIGATGEGLFKEKSGAELRFKRIKGSGNVEVSSTGSDEILITGTDSGGEITTAANVGTVGEGVFKEKVGTELRFKKLKGGTGITIGPSGSDEIQITATGGGGSSTGSDLYLHQIYR